MYQLRMKAFNLVPIILFIFVAVVYTLTLYPDVGGRVNFGDSAKWQYLHVVNGVPHSTGYPIFLALSEVFGRIVPFEQIADRIKMISVIFGALTVVNLYGICRLITNKVIPSILASLIFGFSFTFWSQATEAEVYALNAFFVSIVVLHFLKYKMTTNHKYLLIGSFFYAISFGNHLTMILLLPAIIYITFVTDKRVFLKPKIVISIIGFIILGATQYGYLYYLSHTGTDYLEYLGRNTTFGHFIDYITGKQFNGLMFAYSPVELIAQRIPFFIKLMIIQFSIVGIICLIIGLILMIRKKALTHEVIFLLLIIGFQFLYSINYKIGDIEVYFIPIYLILSIFLSFLLVGRLRTFMTVLLIGVTLYNVYTNTIDRGIIQENWRLAEVERLTSSIPEGSALLIEKPNYHFEHLYNYLSSTGEIGDYKFYYDIGELTETEFYFKSQFLPEMNKNKNVTVTLHEENTIEQTIEKYKEYTIILSVYGDGRHKLSEDTIMFMESIGSNISELKYRDSYVAVIHQETFLVEEMNSDGAISIDNNGNDVLRGLFPSPSIYIRSSGYFVGNYSSIKVDHTEVSRQQTGLNLVVLDEDGKLVHSANFNTNKSPNENLYYAEKK
jgi:hypothetical protein